MNIEEEITGEIIKKVLKALEKKATGYECKEITEEYINDGENEVLSKKKIVKHYVPADISAAKLLLEVCGTKDEKTFYGMSDEVGPISLKNDNGEFDYQMFGKEIEDKIGREVNKLINTAYSDAQTILTQNMAKLHEIAGVLLEKEKINEEEFKKFFA